MLIIDALLDHGATMTAYDPVALAEARQKLRCRMGVLYADSSVQALHGADALIIATGWKVFCSPDCGELKRRLKEPVIFDGRNLYDPGSLASDGTHYYPIGRPQARRAN